MVLIFKIGPFFKKNLKKNIIIRQLTSKGHHYIIHKTFQSNFSVCVASLIIVFFDSALDAELKKKGLMDFTLVFF